MFGKKKTIQKGQLTNIDVDLISLLFDDYKPANGKGVVVKCDNDSFAYKGSSVKHKSDDQGRLFVTVMEPDVKDSQGDIASREAIQQACEQFAQKGMIRKNDVNHNMQTVDDCFIAENYILKSEDKEHFPDTKLGSWVQVIKFKNTHSELWQKVKGGHFNGVSLYGRATDGDSNGQSTFETAKNEILKAISMLKSKNDTTMDSAIKELEAQVKDLETQAKSDSTDRKYKELEKGLNKLVDSINKAINTQIQSETHLEPTQEEVIVADTKVIVKSEKTELYKAIASVDSGSTMNVLSDNLGQQFVDTVVDFSPEDIFTDITVVELAKDEQIDKGFIEDLVLKNTKDGSADDKTVGEFDLDCPTEILTGVLKLKQDTVEHYRDKKGDSAFGAYVEQKLTVKIQKAIKKLFFMGDRNSTDASLKGLDGIIKHMTGTPEHVQIPKDDKTTYAKHLSQCLKTFTNDALSEMAGYKIYCSPKTLLDIQDEIAKRQTPIGDRFLLNNDKVFFKGMELKARFMPDDAFIIGITKFLLLGYRTDATLKIEHSGGEWVWRWFVRVRFGTQYIAGGLVKYFESTEDSTTTP